MGQYYNKGWSVADTNRLAFIVKRLDQDNPLDKKSMHDFAKMGILYRRYRTVKLMSGSPYDNKMWDDVERHIRLNMSDRAINVNDLTDDEWDFICDLPVGEN